MKVLPTTYNLEMEYSGMKCLHNLQDCGGPLAPIGGHVCYDCSLMFEKLLLSKSPVATALKEQLDNPVSALDKQFGKLFER